MAYVVFYKMTSHYIEKALTFGISHQGILMFSEPDFPQIPLQIPGGTIEPAEHRNDAAKREFFEETGLLISAPFLFLETLVSNSLGQAPAVRRHFYTVILPDKLPKTWDHYERHADDRATPILFRFCWVELGRLARILPGSWQPAITKLSPHLIYD